MRTATGGDDMLYGDGADDILSGLGGNDTLYGYGGNDTLDGGAGNDLLDGGDGNDTYLFGRGDGQDVISSCEWNPSKRDELRFKAGVTAADVAVRRQWNDLILRVAETSDQVTVKNHFYSRDGGYPYRVESIRFSDGSAWGGADIEARMIIATEGDDALSGDDMSNVLSGLGGNDTLYGYGGDDTLDGGVGNDSLEGGSGNDTYLFGRGDGQDTIGGWDRDPNKQDVVRFKEDVRPEDVTASRTWWGALTLGIRGMPDQLTVQYYFANGSDFNPGGIEAIRFADGTAWDAAAISMRLLKGSEDSRVVISWKAGL